LCPEKTAYRSLTDAELIFLRHHREAIKAVIADRATTSAADGSSPAPLTPADPRVQLLPTPGQTERAEPERCTYCAQPVTRCESMKADDLQTWRDLHHTHPDEVQRRNEYATAVMLRQMKYGHRRW
jgi:hypothetical protein